MTPALPFRQAVIVGGSGAVGRLLGAALAATDAPSITIVDRRMSGMHPPGASCITADIRQPSAAVLAAVAACDLVVLATPEDVALSALPLLLPQLPATALLVDTLSVKSRFAQAVAGYAPGCELLGINPMFAPDLGIEGRSVVATPYASRARAGHFLELMAHCGAIVVTMNAEEHDRACAALQVATHAAVLGFAVALRACGYDPQAVETIMPPPHRTLLALTGRILAADPAVYHDIQASNPYAAEMRAQLREAQRSLEVSVAAGPEDFARHIEGLRKMLALGSVDYAALCARLFAVR